MSISILTIVVTFKIISVVASFFKKKKRNSNAFVEPYSCLVPRLAQREQQSKWPRIYKLIPCTCTPFANILTYRHSDSDQCGNCTNGTTNVLYNSGLDCTGQTCGQAHEDSCGVCQSIANPINVTTCDGVCFGNASINR